MEAIIIEDLDEPWYLEDNGIIRGRTGNDQLSTVENKDSVCNNLNKNSSGGDTISQKKQAQRQLLLEVCDKGNTGDGRSLLGSIKRSGGNLASIDLTSLGGMTDQAPGNENGISSGGLLGSCPAGRVYHGHAGVITDSFVGEALPSFLNEAEPHGTLNHLTPAVSVSYIEHLGFKPDFGLPGKEQESTDISTTTAVEVDSNQQTDQYIHGDGSSIDLANGTSTIEGMPTVTVPVCTEGKRIPHSDSEVLVTAVQRESAEASTCTEADAELTSPAIHYTRGIQMTAVPFSTAEEEEAEISGFEGLCRNITDQPIFRRIGIYDLPENTLLNVGGHALGKTRISSDEDWEYKIRRFGPSQRDPELYLELSHIDKAQEEKFETLMERQPTVNDILRHFGSTEPINTDNVQQTCKQAYSRPRLNIHYLQDWNPKLYPAKLNFLRPNNYMQDLIRDDDHWGGLSRPHLQLSGEGGFSPLTAADMGLATLVSHHQGEQLVVFVIDRRYSEFVTDEIRHSLTIKEQERIATDCPSFLQGKKVIITPKWLDDRHIPYKFAKMVPGDLFFFPGDCLHFSVSAGVCISLGQCLITREWLFGYTNTVVKCDCRPYLNTQDSEIHTYCFHGSWISILADKMSIIEMLLFSPTTTAPKQSSDAFKKLYEEFARRSKQNDNGKEKKPDKILRLSDSYGNLTKQMENWLGRRCVYSAKQTAVVTRDRVVGKACIERGDQEFVLLPLALEEGPEHPMSRDERVSQWSAGSVLRKPPFSVSEEAADFVEESGDEETTDISRIEDVDHHIPHDSLSNISAGTRSGSRVDPMRGRKRHASQESVSSVSSKRSRAGRKMNPDSISQKFFEHGLKKKKKDGEEVPAVRCLLCKDDGEFFVIERANSARHYQQHMKQQARAKARKGSEGLE